jgi:hypothetical protein
LLLWTATAAVLAALPGDHSCPEGANVFPLSERAPDFAPPEVVGTLFAGAQFYEGGSERGFLMATPLLRASFSLTLGRGWRAEVSFALEHPPPKDRVWCAPIEPGNATELVVQLPRTVVTIRLTRSGKTALTRRLLIDQLSVARREAPREGLELSADEVAGPGASPRGLLRVLLGARPDTSSFCSELESLAGRPVVEAGCAPARRAGPEESAASPQLCWLSPPGSLPPSQPPVAVPPCHAPSVTDAGRAPAQGWQLAPCQTLASILSHSQPAAVLRAPGGGWCLDQTPSSPESLGPLRWKWAHCLASDGGDGACTVLDVPADEPASASLLEARCGPDAVQRARIASATCHSWDFERALRSLPRADLPPSIADEALAGLPRLRSVEPERSAQVGCARVAGSTDGRVRIWTFARAYRGESDHYVADEARRGAATLEWVVDGDHEFQADGLWSDLNLDAAIDGVWPLPGRPNEYLVAGSGLRGFGLVRFAEVVSLEGAHLRRVPDRFVVDGRMQALLLVRGPMPETGKPRHALAWRHWIRLVGNDLQMEPLPDLAPFMRPLGQTKPFSLATWDGTRLRTHRDPCSWATFLLEADLDH